jgi:hypothetical protein
VANSFLYVYKGAFPNGQLLVNNEQSVATTVPCQANDVFQICETNGFIVTSSVKATFIAQATGQCSADFTSLSCK